MVTKRLVEKDFQQIEKKARIHINEKIFDYEFVYTHDYGDKPFDIRYGETETARRQRSSEVKKKLISCFFGLGGRKSLKYVIERVEPYFEGNRPDASQKSKNILRNFRYYNDLMFNALDHFGTHLENARNFISANIFKQWIAAMKLGVYTACDYCVLGRSGLNYPENNDPPVRLNAMREYYGQICMMREILTALEQEIGRWSRGDGDNFNLNNDDWTDYLKSCQEQLNRNFGSDKGKKIFTEIFGGPDPEKPSASEMDNIQMKYFTRLAEELLKGPQESPSGSTNTDNSSSDNFHRDYAGEQEEARRQERERQERAERERQERQDQERPENPQDQDEQERPKTPPSDKNPKNDNIDDDPKPTEEPQKPQEDNSDKEKDEKPDKPPKETSFDSSNLNDIINSLNEALDNDTKEAGNDTPYTPAPGLGEPINTMTKEQSEKLPWVVMGMNLQDLEYIPPYWKLHSPHTIPFGGGGKGDYVTLKLELIQIDEDPRDLYHNFFWAKNPDKKGFERLEVDTSPHKENQKDKETQLLIGGKRIDDIRINEMGWRAWPFNRGFTIQFGVPNVKQKSNRFVRSFKKLERQYYLGGDHFIGVLRDKRILGYETNAFSGRKRGWGDGPHGSVLWITNQMDMRKNENLDWIGDDTKTINPNNGFAHYLLFLPRRTHFYNEQLKLNTQKTLKDYISEIYKYENKEISKEKYKPKYPLPVLVRLGPDTLNLIEAQTPDQKGRSESEDSHNRRNNRDSITDKDLKDLGLTRQEFEELNSPFLDQAKLNNLIKKIASGKDPKKVAEILNRMYNYLNPKTRTNMFKQMVDNNPVFSEKEKQVLKDLWDNAKSDKARKALWEALTSHKSSKEAHGKKTPYEKRDIFTEQVNKNPRYGPPGEDTQERRDRHEEYKKASKDKKAKMEEEENERFTQGENANQWGNYFQDNANREAGAGDESVGSESDNNFDGQFSFTDSLTAINKLKNIGQMKPEGMEEGMKANKPYWEVVFNHPLTYIFLFIGILIAIMAASTRKNK